MEGHLVYQVGTVNLSGSLSLHRVFYLPTFKFNLLSVHHLCKTANICFNCSSSFCYLQDQKTKEILAVGKAMGALYSLDHTSFYNPSSSLVNPNVHDAPSSCNVLASLNNKDHQSLLWYKRFGHASVSTLRHIPFLSHTLRSDLHHCEVCPLAKQPCLHFSPSSIHSTSPFNLIHVDLWVPYTHPCLSNVRYVVTIVDDYSRVTWTHLISYKSHTLSILTRFLKMVTIQFRKNVPALRSDNGTEFTNITFQSLLATHGIIHQRSCVYTPQQNGVVVMG